MAQGPLSELRASTLQTVRVDTDRTEDAARVLTELGLSDIASSPGYVTATLGDVASKRSFPTW